MMATLRHIVLFFTLLLVAFSEGRAIGIERVAKKNGVFEAADNATRLRYSKAWNHLDLAESGSKVDPAVITKLADDILNNPALETFLEGGVGRVKAWEKFANDGLPSVFRTNITNLNQRTILDEWADNIADASNARKGNFGEIGADLDLNAKGYTSLQPRIDNINSPGHNGIDVVVEKNGQYFIVEGKYTGSASLNPANPPNLPRQMSDEWITQGTRLADAVGESVADDILATGYTRVLAKTAPDGSVTYKLIDTDGYVIQGSTGDWIP